VPPGVIEGLEVIDVDHGQRESAVQRFQALDLGWSHFDSRASQGSDKYDGDVFRVGYLYRFR
jgi:hypothetical protein